jgi:hypothetical protein
LVVTTIDPIRLGPIACRAAAFVQHDPRRDRQDPRRQLRGPARIELGDAAQHAHERLLREVVRALGAATEQHPIDQREHAILVELDQRAQRGRVAGARTRERDVIELHGSLDRRVGGHEFVPPRPRPKVPDYSASTPRRR